MKRASFFWLLRFRLEFVLAVHLVAEATQAAATISSLCVHRYSHNSSRFPSGS